MPPRPGSARRAAYCRLTQEHIGEMNKGANLIGSLVSLAHLAISTGQTAGEVALENAKKLATTAYHTGEIALIGLFPRNK